MEIVRSLKAASNAAYSALWKPAPSQIIPSAPSIQVEPLVLFRHTLGACQDFTFSAQSSADSLKQCH